MTATHPTTTLDTRFSSEGATPLPWEDGRGRLEHAEIYWLTTVLSERSAKERCEKDLAEYRAQVMAGMKVSAPTCAQ